MPDLETMLTELVADGWSINILTIDARFIATGTRLDKCIVGIGRTLNEAWAMLMNHYAEVNA